MFANIYLNEIDQYIKHKLHIKYYFRYLDDSIVIERKATSNKCFGKNIKIFRRKFAIKIK